MFYMPIISFSKSVTSVKGIEFPNRIPRESLGWKRESLDNRGTLGLEYPVCSIFPWELFTRGDQQPRNMQSWEEYQANWGSPSYYLSVQGSHGILLLSLYISISYFLISTAYYLFHILFTIHHPITQNISTFISDQCVLYDKSIKMYFLHMNVKKIRMI